MILKKDLPIAIHALILKPVNKKSLKFNSGIFCNMAESKGFEPLIQVLPVYSLSRGAPSTTRPTLRREVANYT